MLRKTVIDFGQPLQPWDGFGINYVEVAQTRDYQANPQEYGGFSTLCEADRQEIVELIFGDDGLKPCTLKMFHDCWHQPKPGPDYDWDPNAIDPAAYDHDTTTQWMRYFVREGLKRTRARGDDLAIITTLYGPPAWMTAQKFVRGRDLDPQFETECAKYIIAWAKHLREVEGFPVQYVSLHNEGEDWVRWPLDGSTASTPNHDYNLYWPPEQVAEFVRMMRPMLDAQGMQDVGVSPGETSNWYRFTGWGYADALADPETAQALGLITSHGFFGRGVGRWYGDWRSAGIDAIRAQNPGLHAWVTSTSWGAMDASFCWEMYNNIYSAKVNSIIPWAAVQTNTWVGGDPNPGTAIRVSLPSGASGGQYTVEPGYYFYKQVCRAGQAGMAVTQVRANDSSLALIGFASNDTEHPDAFVVINISEDEVEMDLETPGTTSGSFEAFRTSEDERYVAVGRFTPSKVGMAYQAPPRSVTTFFGS
jgi:hypothetical protein